MRNSGKGSFSSKFHFSPPPRVAADTTPPVKPPNCAWYGVEYTLKFCTASIGTVIPNCPVAGSVISTELTSSAVCFSSAPATTTPSAPRTTPAISGSASATVAGWLGASFICCRPSCCGAAPPSSDDACTCTVSRFSRCGSSTTSSSRVDTPASGTTCCSTG